MAKRKLKELDRNDLTYMLGELYIENRLLRNDNARMHEYIVELTPESDLEPEEAQEVQ